MTKIAGVLFDKDGTLLDFDATWGPATEAVLRALSDGDAACFDDLAASCGFLAVNLGFAADSPIIAGDMGAFAPAWAARLGVAYDEAFAERVNALYRAASLGSLTAYDDVATGLDALLAAGVAVGLGTNDSEKTARAHLQALRLEGRFAFVAGYDSGFGPKPSPGMILAFAEHLGVAPDAVAMVGDAAHDMEAARAAGAVAIGIVRTRAAERALAGRTDVTVRGMGELARVVTGFGAVERDGLPKHPPLSCRTSPPQGGRRSADRRRRDPR